MTGEVDVVIIGAGAAGVGAARRLSQARVSTLLVEAGGWVGGRARTEALLGMPLDLGCGYLHSAPRNPWTQIAEETGFAIDRGAPAWRVQYQGLGFSAAEQAEAEAYWRAWRDRLDAAPPASDRASDALPEGRWAAYAQALSGYINGAPLEQVSVRDYLAYDNAAGEENWRVPDGYGALVARGLPPVALRLATPVRAIDFSAPLISLETPAGAIRARTAIVTVSTHVLASGAIRFTPAIDDKLHAAACLPLGFANKLWMAIADPALFEAETHVMGNPHRAETGSYYLRPFGRPAVECFFGGAGAADLEQAGLDAAFAFAREELTALFGSAIDRSLKALHVTTWGALDLIGGAYSHALPGQSARRAELAAPLAARLFFAGEATHAKDFSTAHGAYLSGLRAAEEALESLERL